MIPHVLAHEGENHSIESEINTLSIGKSATTVTYLILILIIFIGGFLLVYNYGMRNKK